MKKLLNSAAAIGVFGMTFGTALSAENAEAMLNDFATVSEISLPLSIGLGTVQTAINAQVPVRLVTVRENNMKCVEAKWAITKIPEFRGLKIYSKTIKTKISPDIYCDLNGHVDRRSDITLSGEGSKIRFSLPVHASVTAKAGVQETAIADATIFVEAVPGISPDWTPTMDVQANFHWDKRPTLKLFDLIKVTIGGKVEPKLREELAKLEASVPQMMTDIDVRGEVETLWMDVQKPVQIADNPSVYATFKPTGVGFSGLNVVGDNLNAQVAIRGETLVVVGEMPAYQPVPLLPLERINPSDGRFSLAVPAVIEQAELQAAVDTQVGEGFSVNIDEGAIPGAFSADDIRISMDREKGLRLTADIAFDNRANWLKTIDIFDWFDFSGTVSLDVVPAIDSENNRVYAANLRVASNTTSELADTLVQVIDLPIIRDEFAKLLAYDYSGDLDTAMTSANEAIAGDLIPGATINGSVESAGVEDLVVSDGAMMIVAKAEGQVALQVSELSN